MLLSQPDAQLRQALGDHEVDAPVHHHAVAAEGMAIEKELEDAVQSANALAGEGWTQRLGTGPRGPGEVFLAAAYQHVRARSSDENFYSLEADTQPMGEELMLAVGGLSRGLTELRPCQPLDPVEACRRPDSAVTNLSRVPPLASRDRVLRPGCPRVREASGVCAEPSWVLLRSRRS